MSNPVTPNLQAPSKRFEARKYNDNPQSEYYMVTDKRGCIHTTNALSRAQADAIIAKLHRIVAATGEGVTYNAAVQVEMSVTPLDPLDVTLRLEQMAELRDGWLDGEGNAPKKERLAWLADMFDAHFDGDLPLPYLYPTAEGRVQAEWTMNGREVSLEIDLETKQGEYQALNLKDDSCSDLKFTLDNPGGWSHLNEALKQLDAQTVEEKPADMSQNLELLDDIDSVIKQVRQILPFLMRPLS